MRTKLSLFLLFLLLCSCSKEKMCKDLNFCVRVNGKMWWAGSSDFKANPLNVNLVDDKQFWIGAKNGSSSMIFGVIDPSNRIQARSYVLGVDKNTAHYRKNGVSFDADAQHTGVLNITSIDRARKRISGTFHFKAFNAATGEVVDISNGVFNIGYAEF